MAYDETYELARALPDSPLHGPLNIYAKGFFDLLVAWWCSRAVRPGSLDVWDRLGRAGHCRLARALLDLRRPGRRLLGISRWRRTTALVAELLWYLAPLLVPRPLPRAYRCALEDALR